MSEYNILCPSNSNSVPSLNSSVHLLFNERFHILSLIDLFQHVPDIIIIVYIDLLLEVGHVILQPGAFLSRLMIRLKVSPDAMDEKNKIRHTPGTMTPFSSAATIGQKTMPCSFLNCLSCFAVRLSNDFAPSIVSLTTSSHRLWILVATSSYFSLGRVGPTRTVARMKFGRVGPRDVPPEYTAPMGPGWSNAMLTNSLGVTNVVACKFVMNSARASFCSFESGIQWETLH